MDVEYPTFACTSEDTRVYITHEVIAAGLLDAEEWQEESYS